MCKHNALHVSWRSFCSGSFLSTMTPDYLDPVEISTPSIWGTSHGGLVIFWKVHYPSPSLDYWWTIPCVRLFLVGRLSKCLSWKPQKKAVCNYATQDGLCMCTLRYSSKRKYIFRISIHRISTVLIQHMDYLRYLRLFGYILKIFSGHVQSLLDELTTLLVQPGDNDPGHPSTEPLGRLSYCFWGMIGSFIWYLMIMIQIDVAIRWCTALCSNIMYYNVFI